MHAPFEVGTAMYRNESEEAQWSIRAIARTALVKAIGNT